MSALEPTPEQRLEALRLLVETGDTRTISDPEEDCLSLDHVRSLLLGQPLDERVETAWKGRWWDQVNAALVTDRDCEWCSPDLPTRTQFGLTLTYVEGWLSGDFDDAAAYLREHGEEMADQAVEDHCALDDGTERQ